MGREAKSSASPSPRRPASRNHQQQTTPSCQPPRDPMRKRGRASSRPPAQEAMPTPAAGWRASVRGCPCGVRRGDRGGPWAGGERAVAPLLSALLKSSVREASVVCVCEYFLFFFFIFPAWDLAWSGHRVVRCTPASGPSILFIYHQVDPLGCIVALFAVRI